MTELVDITKAQIIHKLDEIQPNWWIEWADQTDLHDLAMVYVNPQDVKLRVIRKIWPMAQAIYLITQEK